MTVTRKRLDDLERSFGSRQPGRIDARRLSDDQFRAILERPDLQELLDDQTITDGQERILLHAVVRDIAEMEKAPASER